MKIINFLVRDIIFLIDIIFGIIPKIKCGFA